MAPYRQSPPKIPHDVILAAADFSSEFVKYVMPALLQQESTREKLAQAGLAGGTFERAVFALSESAISRA